MSKRTYVSPYNFVIIYAALGDKDKALEFLERAYDERSYYMTWLNVDFQLDSLRDDPRFKDIVRRTGLTD
jgi:hypothetical protein